MMYSDKNQQLSNQTTSSSSAVPLEAIDRPQVPVASQEATLQLLEERVVVDRSKRKIGEVIVRKEVETYMVQVPVRRERLIVEQVSPESKQLASIDLAQGEPTGIEFSNGTNGSITQSTITGSFTSLEAASQALAELAAHVPHQDQQVRVEISLPEGSVSPIYQNWLSRFEK